MTLSYVQDGEILTIPCPAAGTTVALWYQIGGIFGQALKTTTSGLDLELYVPEPGTVVRMTKATGFIPAAGDVAFFDFGSDNRLESFAFGGQVTPIGFYAAAALTGDTAAEVIWDPARARHAVIREKILIPLDATKAVTKTGYFEAPFTGKIVGLSYLADVKPSSSAGTVVGTLANLGVSSHTLINAATFDFEGMTEDAVTAFTLTATAADLAMAVGTLASFAIAADNTDMVAGSGIYIYVDFVRTP